ncbi:oxygen-independent coproporphyrinogen III oxidase [Stakelama marina]|uniref:Coproporphyrinogen-III oxidase n=1 Tax=Stakelama marina TaxID=2826939 RepID=A0A8T4I9C8_9SPHN|nr:oxygen-independent coproporphyrinogen III oxidase [Stakelama marina]MBR0551247.1 oxygen-independent coproporphyrinogen III oxidase [Stakelama marina]
MWTYYPDLLARPVPRYTSYPTAAEFVDTVGPADLADALDTVGEGDALSLYLHIPYCQSICWYCGCNTGAANRPQRLTNYLERLEREIQLVADRLSGRGRVGRIAFGGGSPNAIEPAAFLRLTDRLRSAFACDDAILSVELDPRGFSPAWADAMAQAGVTRASLGVQTLDPAIQAAIGRVQPEEDIRRTMEMLRAAGLDSINFDLMYGLPGQDSDVPMRTMEASLAMAPDRLAVFGYAHVPHMIPRQRRIDANALPGAERRFAQAALAHDFLTGAGYSAIGFDHFAKPGDALALAAADGSLRRNFQGFTEDQARVLIGLGASAISEFPAHLLQNEKNAGRYQIAVAAGRFATARGVGRTRQDRVRGAAIEALLCHGSAELTALGDLSAIRDRLRPFADHGLIEWQGDVLRLRRAAVPYARAIAATLDAYRADSAIRFSSAV